MDKSKSKDKNTFKRMFTQQVNHSPLYINKLQKLETLIQNDKNLISNPIIKELKENSNHDSISLDSLDTLGNKKINQCDNYEIHVNKPINIKSKNYSTFKQTKDNNYLVKDNLLFEDEKDEVTKLKKIIKCLTFQIESIDIVNRYVFAHIENVMKKNNNSNIIDNLLDNELNKIVENLNDQNISYEEVININDQSTSCSNLVDILNLLKVEKNTEIKFFKKKYIQNYMNSIGKNINSLLTKIKKKPSKLFGINKGITFSNPDRSFKDYEICHVITCSNFDNKNLFNNQIDEKQNVEKSKIEIENENNNDNLIENNTEKYKPSFNMLEISNINDHSKINISVNESIYNKDVSKINGLNIDWEAEYSAYEQYFDLAFKENEELLTQMSSYFECKEN